MQPRRWFMHAVTGMVREAERYARPSWREYEGVWVVRSCIVFVI